MSKNTAILRFCLSPFSRRWYGNGFFCFLCIFVAIFSGCVERRLTINTNPSGAQVLLNDEDIGVSPVTTTFKWYGDYNITLRKPGCETLNTHQKLESPWYDYFPFDFFAQVIYPGRIIDSYQWSFDLKPSTEPSRDTLITQAEQLKQQTN
jgi:hypothetical protein